MNWTPKHQEALDRANGVARTEEPEMPPKVLEKPIQGLGALLALARVLDRAGATTAVITLRSWSLAQRGEAYLWGIAFLGGREDLPAPLHVTSWRKR